MSEKTRALITNDDGIDSPGLKALLVAALEAGLDPVVAAPSTEASGSGASIVATQTDGRIVFDRRVWDDFPDVPVFAVPAAPGMIALLAANKSFGRSPHFVLSGVNRGANVGHAILHSGTVGAALTGAAHGARALAVSLDVGFTPELIHWRTACQVARSCIDLLARQPGGTVLNLNVPNVDMEELGEPREVPLAPFGIVQTLVSEADQTSARLTVAEAESGHFEPGSDAEVLSSGQPTLTAIRALVDVPVVR